MEIMEDGNLIDRVRILLQRDMQYYQEMQTVLCEPLCIRVSGGKFDFPRHASFAAIKIVTWWEAEFLAAFKHPSGLSLTNQDNVEDTDDAGVVKKTQPSEFISLVIETSEQLLDHLHKLIQESLDHADLTVLTATLGAAALISNCLWCYNKRIKTEVPELSSTRLNEFYKAYTEMTEVVGERLVDLHCRLVSLYILNEAESLKWESDIPFFQNQRCSFVTQMWWLYMQGTKTDLWNTVSPKMAQRILSGILNDSLSIIVSRYMHGRPSIERSMQFWADAFNVLSCTAHLSLNVFVSGAEMIGLNEDEMPIYARDIHAKCNELLKCFLLRGTPLNRLFQVVRKGLENLTISETRSGPSPWLYVCAPDLLGISHDDSKGYQPLTGNQAVILELNVLKSQPQCNSIQLIKVLSMNNYSLAKLILAILVRKCIGQIYSSNITSPKQKIEVSKTQKTTNEEEEESCGGFLCPKKMCKRIHSITPSMALYGLTFILLYTPCDPNSVIITAIKQDPDWSKYLDRDQVWNMKKPHWLNAIVDELRSVMTPIVETLLDAIETGASIYQAMSLALSCLFELHECMSLGVIKLALAMDENVPANCRPLGGSVILQVMCSALYSALIDLEDRPKDWIVENMDEQQCSKTEYKAEQPEAVKSFDRHDRSASAIALSEAVCSIDKDNKHTEQINDLLDEIRKSTERREAAVEVENIDDLPWIIESYADELAFTEIGRTSLKIMYEYVLRTSNYLLKLLKADGKKILDSRITAIHPVPIKPLTYTMFHIGQMPFDRLLSNYEELDWELMFKIPLSIPTERIRTEILARSQLMNILKLEQNEREAANFIKKICIMKE